MADMVRERMPRRHPVIPDLLPVMIKASIRKPDQDTWKAEIGAAVRTCRGLLKLSIKEFAARVNRDERTVSRWEDGRERPQLDAILYVKELRQPMILALTELAAGQDSEIEIETVVRMRRKTG